MKVLIGVSLTVAEKHLCAIEDLNGEVNNGGFAQYFFNPSGAHWRDALAGLQAVGATKRLAIFRKVISRFGKDGPADEWAERDSQLAKLAEDEVPFQGENGDWYDIKGENLAALLYQYSIQNLSGRERADEE